jgi:hypothetical protein
MIDIAKIKVGDKVHFIGFEGSQPENGMVKEVMTDNLKAIRVVYNCAGNWENFKDYTSALTEVKYLHLGWKH